MAEYSSEGSHPEAFVRSFGEALEGIGFATITGHDIPFDFIVRTYKAARRLFQLSDARLMKYERFEIGRQRGFTPFRTEQAKDGDKKDLKRFWHIGDPKCPEFGENVWPDEVPEFGRLMRPMYNRLSRLSRRLLRTLDSYLGYIPDTLPSMVKDGNTLMRVLHYPAIEDGWEGMRADEHEDINLITLLVAGTASGLQVKTRDGIWVSVNEAPNSIVVNVGDMLQMLTKRRLVSTSHRVVNHDGERFSLPFFVHPRSDVVLHHETSYTAGEYLKRRLIEINVLKGNLEKLRPMPQF